MGGARADMHAGSACTQAAHPARGDGLQERVRERARGVARAARARVRHQQRLGRERERIRDNRGRGVRQVDRNAARLAGADEGRAPGREPAAHSAVLRAARGVVRKVLQPHQPEAGVVAEGREGLGGQRRTASRLRHTTEWRMARKENEKGAGGGRTGHPGCPARPPARATPPPPAPPQQAPRGCSMACVRRGCSLATRARRESRNTVVARAHQQPRGEGAAARRAQARAAARDVRVELLR